MLGRLGLLVLVLFSFCSRFECLLFCKVRGLEVVVRMFRVVFVRIYLV